MAGRVDEKASEDGAAMSPILLAQLPLGYADAVAFPSTPAEIAAVVAAAVLITPRG